MAEAIFWLSLLAFMEFVVLWAMIWYLLGVQEERQKKEASGDRP